MILTIKLFIASLLLASCASNSSNKSSTHDRTTNPCSSFGIRLDSNDVSLSYTKKLNFGPIHVGDTTYADLTFYTKSKELNATNIVGQITSQQYSFGGSFPGINPSHGGCSSTLQSNKSCKINLQFTPNTDLPFSGLFILTFKVGSGICKQVVDLRGTGIKRL